MNAIHSTIPSENWDDDFEFNQQKMTTTTSANGTNDRHVEHRLSMASSDWDHDDDFTEKKPTHVTLSEWAEPGPSTPRKPSSTRSTENWDDDFEDSPARHAFPSPPRKERSSLRQSHVPKPEKVENWDEEFEDTRTLPKPAPSTPSSKALQSRVTNLGSYSSSEDEDGNLGDEGDMELGYSERDEEDRTVTARSRRAALARLTTNAKSSPPPPVPNLPLPFLITQSNSSSNPHPFPRSPTTSVFTVPRPPSSSGYTVTSTTHLRPTLSRSSSSGLSALPPSPPIHRERRRLRKKSRPAGVAGGDAPKHRDHEYDGYERDEDMEPESDVRPRTPPNQPVNGVNGTPAGANTSSGSNSGAGALLSRIGSVKKWGVRKKRGSTTPAEALALDITTRNRFPDTDHNLTPRPKSQASMASMPSSSESSRVKIKRMSASPITSSTSNTNWFFRSGSGGSTNTTNTVSSATSAYPSSISTTATSAGPRGSMSELNLRDRGMGTINITTPTKPLRDQVYGEPVSPPATPSKLLKRKSLGFVQLRRGLGGHVGYPEDERRDKEGKRRVSANTAQQLKYGGLGIGRVNGDPFPRDSDREKASEAEDDDDDNDEKQGIEGGGPGKFMRRLSLTGRHQRTKSGVSLRGAPEIGRLLVSVPPRDDTVTPRPGPKQRQQLLEKERQGMGSPSPSPAAPPAALLPPIELQPPSPPQTVSPATGIRSAPSASGLSDHMLLPSSSRSPLVPTTSRESPKNPPNPPSPSQPSHISPSRRSIRTPGSPQSASLGRSTIAPAGVAGPTPGSVGIHIGERERATMARRNSLGDLKIPERISQAQVGLRRDLGMVREFAANIEQMKELQAIYQHLVTQVQGILDEQMLLHAQQQEQEQQSSRATSPSFFGNLSRTRTRLRSNTGPPPSRSTISLPGSSSTSTVPPQIAYKQLASAFYTINSRYRISWECAELLIELGGGSSTSPSPPSTSASAPAMHSVISGGEMKKGTRERAITLAGDESKPPTPIPGAAPGTSGFAAAGKTTGPPLASPPSSSSSWRASTGKPDLSQRQMVLLKEMLNTAESTNALVAAAEEEDSAVIPSGGVLNVNKEWRWGDAMSSTVTLPSEDSSTGGEMGKPRKKKGGKLGMLGLRDLLRSLKRSYSESASTSASALVLPPPPPSSNSMSGTDNSSQEGHIYQHSQVPPESNAATTTTTHGRRRAKTSTGPESVRTGRPTSPCGPSSLKTKSSPRRPSLASIFRLGHKKEKPSPPHLPLNLRDNMSRPDLMRPDSARSMSRNEHLSTGEEEEDWDQIDLALGNGTVRGKGSANGKGRSPYLQELNLPPGHRPLTPKRSVSGSQLSVWREPSGGDSPPPLPQQGQTRATRLSNVEEHADGHQKTPPMPPRSSSRASRRHGKAGASPSSSRPPSRDVRITKTASVRSMPQPPVLAPSPEIKLAMTPENIKPLLENAKEVILRLDECIAEIQALLGAYAPS